MSLMAKTPTPPRFEGRIRAWINLHIVPKREIRFQLPSLINESCSFCSTPKIGAPSEAIFGGCEGQAHQGLDQNLIAHLINTKKYSLGFFRKLQNVVSARGERALDKTQWRGWYLC